MSATGRGSARREENNYPTPPWTVRRALEQIYLPGGQWIEPCAGAGAIVRSVSQLRDEVRWGAVDLRASCRPQLERFLGKKQILIGSLLDRKVQRQLRRRWPDAQVVFTNPPFPLAQECIEASLELAPIVVMLLRTNMLHSQKRHAWLSHHMPDVYVLPERPSFVKMRPTKAELVRALEAGRKPRWGTQDACEYAWMVFRRGRREFGQVVLLARTPRAERLRWGQSPELREVQGHRLSVGPRRVMSASGRTE